MHEVLVNRLGGLSLPRKSVVRLTDRPDMTLDVYRGRKTTMQQIYLSYNRRNTVLGFNEETGLFHLQIKVYEDTFRGRNSVIFIIATFSKGSQVL